MVVDYPVIYPYCKPDHVPCNLGGDHSQFWQAQHLGNSFGNTHLWTLYILP